MCMSGGCKRHFIVHMHMLTSISTSTTGTSTPTSSAALRTMYSIAPSLELSGVSRPSARDHTSTATGRISNGSKSSSGSDGRFGHPPVMQLQRGTNADVGHAHIIPQANPNFQQLLGACIDVDLVLLRFPYCCSLVHS